MTLFLLLDLCYGASVRFFGEYPVGSTLLCFPLRKGPFLFSVEMRLAEDSFFSSSGLRLYTSLFPCLSFSRDFYPLPLFPPDISAFPRLFLQPVVSDLCVILSPFQYPTFFSLTFAGLPFTPALTPTSLYRPKQSPSPSLEYGTKSVSLRNHVPRLG